MRTNAGRQDGRSLVLVLLVLLVYFVISFVTNALGPIFPALIREFALSDFLAGLFPFAFFIAYGVMSIPAGMLVEHWGERRCMLLAFALMATGAAFVAWRADMLSVLLALFAIGAAMAVLQVAINPLLRIAGGEMHFAFNSVLAQLLFGLAAALSPLAFQQLVSGESASAWRSLYACFAAIGVLMLVLVAACRFPRVQRLDAERSGSWQIYRQLWALPLMRRYFFAVLAYVATEQGLANALSLYLWRYFQLDPDQAGATLVSRFWLAMTGGCLLGLLLLKLSDARHLLIGFAVATMLSLLLALTGDAREAQIGFVACGFFLSIMWSVIVSLALNSLPAHHGAATGILCTGILGGALAPPLIGLLADVTGSLRLSLLVLLLPLLYICWTAAVARPLVNNARFFRARLAEGKSSS